ncbi:MAG TPA: cupin domain-containing protein [Candidatus Limisoma intestinavium]|uniref:Cupin domain-containing protein n=1 Tax=Candidatus Limisoma intestinavium TaxID=2840856 RepID=A0A9D1LHP5_9BACT|nr:cupin domain-containing protein [Candidatus Limisoma intestinavium]
MKQIEQIAEATNFKAINLGKFSNLNEYELALGTEIRIHGKVFGGTAIGATGCEFSMQMFQPGAETGFLHSHKKHEELYFFLAGNGEFQVDGQIFPVKEGSIVKVSPNGKRSVRNNGIVPLVMLCIQYRSDSFSEDDSTDGIILNESVEW